MRVLVVGATGLIGSAITAALLRQGHAVLGTTRRQSREASLKLCHLDFRFAREPDWLPLLKDIDAVINCVGVLQDSSSDSTQAAHARGPAALFAACEAADVPRIIHFSAIGVDRETPTEFSSSKALGDATLMATGLDWIILRPSVVVGASAYGGSALFRGLAALPVLPRLRGAGDLQIVQLTDIVATVLYFLRPDAPTRLAIELAGPERLSFEDVIDAYRMWMGGRPARRIGLPDWMMRFAYALGNFAGWLGWRPPIRSTAAIEMGRGAVGDAAEWIRLTGIKPTALQRALSFSPPLGSGTVVLEALSAEAGDFHGVLAVLDRYGVHVSRSRLGYRYCSYARRGCHRHRRATDRDRGCARRLGNRDRHCMAKDHAASSLRRIVPFADLRRDGHAACASTVD